MIINCITDALVDKVNDTIYIEWKHEGYITLQHSTEFFCIIDDKMYKVSVKECKESEVEEDG